MNKQSVFYLKLIAKKNAYKVMIEDCQKDADKNDHKKEFWLSEVDRFKAKLVTTEEIINDYLIG